MPNVDTESFWYEHRYLGIQPTLVVLYSFCRGYYVFDAGRMVDFQAQQSC